MEHLNYSLSTNTSNCTLYNCDNNITTNTSVTPEWALEPIFSLTTFITGLISNSIILYLFIKDPLLRTPFNIYLINLTLANLILVLVQYPMDIVYNLYSFTWILGNYACTLYI